MESINVAVGIICRNFVEDKFEKNSAEKQFLISYRHPHLHQGDLWEFPGGKIESGETLSAALSRELKEELGITVINQIPLFEINHSYPDKNVCLHICLVNQFTGKENGKEKQPIKWVNKEQLAKHQFPAANNKIVDYILNDL
jgi:8-oxo-dGTP diphosphatase